MTSTSTSTTTAIVPRRRSRLRAGPAAAVAFVTVVAVLSASPVIYLLFASITGGEQPFSTWLEMFHDLPIAKEMTNSFVVAGCASAVVVFVGAMAGFAFGKLGFWGSRALFGVVISLIAVPLATIILPNYFNFAAVQGLGSYWSATTVYAAINLPFAIVLMAAFFTSLPDELMESATLDGSNTVQCFTRIMLPLALPAMVIVLILTFLSTWNDLLVSLLFLPGDDVRTVSVGVSALAGVHQPNISLKLTASLFSAIPPLVAFVAFQRYIISGITQGVHR